MISRLWRRFVAYMMQPMTQRDHDNAMAMAGAQRCPCCGRYHP